MAALLKSDPALNIGELAEELVVEEGRLERLAYEDGSGAGGLSVAAAFELSSQRLDDTSARVFRLLPVNHGPDVSTAAVAVLAGLPVSATRRVLGRLYRAHLIEAAPGVSGRWRMHDLLRLYAQRLAHAHAEADGREEARDRLLEYYLTMTEAADDHLRAPQKTGNVRALPGMGHVRALQIQTRPAPQIQTGPSVFADRDAALAWLDAERASLVAAVIMAADADRDQAAMRLPIILANYAIWRRRFDDMLATNTISLNAARRMGDRACESSALNYLGVALQGVRRFEEAISAHQAAVALCREIGNRHGEAAALGNLGLALREVGNFDEAIAAFLKAGPIYQQTGDRQGERMTLSNIGLTLRTAGQIEKAINICQQALAACRHYRDRHGEGMTLDNLGTALQEDRRFDEAITAHQDAVVIFRETGDAHAEAGALVNLALALQAVGKPEEAIAALESSAVIFREAGDLYNERLVLNGLEAVRAPKA